MPKPPSMISAPMTARVYQSAPIAEEHAVLRAGKEIEAGVAVAADGMKDRVPEGLAVGHGWCASAARADTAPMASTAERDAQHVEGQIERAAQLAARRRSVAR